jgi:NADH:ubiquinone reductase (H+-translocating)
MDEHKLVIVGGGVAGLDLASHLAGRRTGDRRLAVTLIDREPAYVWKPVLHTVAAGTADAGMQQTVYAAQALSRSFTYEPGEAVAVDRRAREVRLGPLSLEGAEVAPARNIPYDTLVLAVGSRANDFGTPGVAQHCARIDTRSDALAFNDRLRFELVKRTVAGTSLTIGIVGGGATGVELAAELVQAATVAERYGLREASRRFAVVLIEAGPRLLPPFPDAIAESVRATLQRIGVEVRTGTPVAAVEAGGFRLGSGERVAADLMVWAAGVKAPPLMDSLGDLERTRTGQLVVGHRLVTDRDPRILALGDCASVRLPGRDKPPPTTAQAASQQARYLCRHLPDIIAGRSVPPAGYRDFGSLVSLGGYDAYGTLGRFGFLDGFLRGRVAQLGHALLYGGFEVRLHGLWKGSLLWLLDTIARRVRRPAMQS